MACWRHDGYLEPLQTGFEARFARHCGMQEKTLYIFDFGLLMGRDRR
jgi:hypothetical protein